MNNPKELLERPIPGLTGKQLIAIILFVFAAASAYIDIKNGIKESRKQSAKNYELMEEIKEEFKQDRKVDDARLHLIELQINECKTRLNIMDKFIEGYNKPLK